MEILPPCTNLDMSYQQSSNTAPFEPLPSASTGPAQPSFNSSAFANEAGTDRVNKYETRLPIRLDIEAALAYVFLCFSGVVLLILETQNDYVRFHAWQSSLYFLALFMIQFLVSLLAWKAFVWIIFALQMFSVLFLGYQAFINSDTLNRFKIPFIGDVQIKRAR